MIKTRVETDLGTDSGPQLVYCKWTQCWSIIADRHLSKSTNN